MALPGTNLLIAIDDTDNLDSRGTGASSRALLEALVDDGLGQPVGITRHQLLVDPAIPYTSHNSSACLAWRLDDASQEPAATARAIGFLEEVSAPGSDPGLAVAAPRCWADPAVRADLAAYGWRAKSEVLDQAAARALAARAGVHLSGHGGTEGGVIGALAAVGLHLSGADGRFLWLPGIRSLAGEMTYQELQALVPINAARDASGRQPASGDRILLGDWVRPVLSGGQVVLLLEPGPDEAPGTWSVSAKDVVKER